MSLAVLVVYLVAPGNEPLLDLHLQYIDRYTEGDYTIYGSANRLSPALTARLHDHPRVKLCQIPTTDKRLAEEHSYYLQALLEAAINDGADQFAIFHVDSFPIEKGWNRKVFDSLNEQYVLFTTSKKGDPVKPTSFLCFTRDFYLKYKPALRIPESEKDTDTCQHFQHQYSAVVWDSGIGYLYKAYLENLDWHGLERMAKSGGCAIYGDMLFHLEMAHMVGPVATTGKNPIKRNMNHLLNRIKYALMPFIPKKVLMDYSNPLRKVLAGANKSMVLKDKFALEREDLFQNPEKFIQQMRQKHN